jgi:hypothetical protein
VPCGSPSEIARHGEEYAVSAYGGSRRFVIPSHSHLGGRRR